MADIFSIGISGLNVSKKGMETTGHNVANANTEGYTRQRVDITTGIPVVKDGLTQGTGARVAGIRRIGDGFIEKKLNMIITEDTYNELLADKLGQLEAVFGDIDGEGFNKILTRFFNSFSELAGNPEDEAIRSYVRENAAMVAKDFVKMDSDLIGVARDMDTQITMQIDDINDLANQVAKLNKKITVMVATGGNANDLMDQRDMAVRNISKFLKVTTYEDNRHNYNVNIDGAGTLVSGGIVNQLQVNPFKDKNGKITHGLEVYFEARPSFPITAKIKNGSLGAAIFAKNDIVGSIKNKLDNIAFGLVKTVNSIHQKGFVNRTITNSPEETPPASDAYGPTTGINFFKDIDGPSGASSQVEISDLVKADLSNITTGLLPSMPGDNRVALAISKVPHQKLLNDGRATLEEEYLKSIADVGMAAGKAKLNHDQTQGILAQFKSLKERISGVSLDEEATNLIRYQNAYQASAKVIKESEQMINAVLDLKR